MALALYIIGPLVLAFAVALLLRWYGERYGFPMRDRSTLRGRSLDRYAEDLCGLRRRRFESDESLRGRCRARMIEVPR